MRRAGFQRRDAVVQVPAQGSRQDPAGLVFVIFRPGVIHEVQAVVGRRYDRLFLLFFALFRRPVGDHVAQRRQVAVHGQRIQRLYADGQAGLRVEDRLHPFQDGRYRRHLVEERHAAAAVCQMVRCLCEAVEDGAVAV